MNADLVPAVVAAGAGSALMGSILALEAKRAAVMRRSRVRLDLRFGRDLETTSALAAAEALAGLSETGELVAEVTAIPGRIAHGLWVPESEVAAVRGLLSGALGSVRAEAADGPSGQAMLALRLWLPMPVVLYAGEPVSACRALLAGLAALHDDEQIVVRWALQPGKPKQPEPDEQTRPLREASRMWQRKLERPGMFAEGLVLVRAATLGRARELARQIESVVRGRRGSVGAVRIRRQKAVSLALMPKVRRRSGWLSADELLGLLGWPLGAAVPNVEPCAPMLPVPEHVPDRGRRLFIGRDWRGERPVALDVTAARHHALVAGPSGSGKSELLARGVLDEIAAGHGGVLVDPKADLVEAVLKRVAPKDADRVVVLDPADTTRPVPGLAVLGGTDIDLATDVLLGALRSIFADVWGVRSDWFGRLAIRTLSAVPGATLADIGRLFEDAAFRRSALARLDDEFTRTAWGSYEALSPAAQADVVQAPVNRVMELLSRPRVRAVLASPDPKLNVGRLLAERKWLLVNLAPGQLGEAGARLLGAVVMYLTWSAIEARVALPPADRHPVHVVVDELASLESLPFSFERLAERARGLGAGLTVACQSLAQVGERTRSSLLANAATIVSFRAPAEEAPRLARVLAPLSADDLQSLGRFEVAARVATGSGSAGTLITGRTEPLPPPTGQAERIRERSARTYGPAPVAASMPPASPPDDLEIGVRRPS